MKQNNTSLEISIKDLTKRYGNIYALDTVSLDIKAGEFLTLLGPSGSGKTTLLMAIAGFNRPDSGSIKFANQEMILTPPHKREVGMVFQNYALFPHMSVFENIGFPLKLRKAPSDQIKEKVHDALKTVQLSDYADRKIDQLSGGQRQRVALARAFVFGPRILLMDEPLSALDKKLREQMQIELKQLHRKLGVTTVYVTHDQREALTMSDRIAVINEGKIEQLGTPKEIYNSPNSSFVADFIGESSFLQLNRKGNDLYFSSEKIITNKKLNKNKEWAMVIRPERLSIVNKSYRKNSSNIHFSGEISELVFQGETALALVKLMEGNFLSVRLSTKSSDDFDNLKTGNKIQLCMNRKDVIIIPH